ncbi:MAG: sulfatase [Planctomycetota bacterium]|nr:sulfatase [Planctomycetota bacterium]
MVSANATRPNVVWVFGDQHRAQAQGHMGDPNLATPHLDRLAADGLVSTAAVAGCPLCCPYRGSLLSGRYPHHCVPGHQYPMATEQQTVAHAFKSAGYHTAWFGKWHVDGWQEHQGRAAHHIVPPERRGGFDTWVGYENNNSQWDTWVHGGRDGSAFLERLPGFETDALTDRFIKHLKDRSAQGGQPFFAALSVQPPHDPYIAPAEWMARHSPATVRLRPNVPEIPRVVEKARREYAGYCAMIENLDWNLGRIQAALEESGLTDETHVIFFSDHGDMHGSHGMFRKTNPYEESIRVPFILGGARARYRFKLGRKALPINHVDMAPTTLGLCGIAKPGWMEGFDYSGHYLKDRSTDGEPDSAYLQLVVPTLHGDSTDRAWRGVVTRDGWKYVCIEGQPWLLFNLNEDPYELANLAHNTLFRAERKRLHERLAQWLADTGDEFNLPKL